VGTGDLTITLTWHSSEGIDLDLRVLEPNENEIYYGDPSSSTGGQLDIDNRCQNYVNGRPENIYWEAAPPGNYRINVNWYGTCGESSETTTSYEVRVINGSGIKTYTGTITAGEVVTVDTITVN
jgi:uncharacterized protein YfaP (DUF2135 family)